MIHRIAIPLIVSLLVTSSAFAQLPPGEPQAKAALEKSPRHGEYVDIKVDGRATPLRAYVVYPERKEKAPVVIVMHEIFGLTDWIRGVTDQLAADGFIAIAPDYVTGLGKDGGATDSFASRDDVVKAVRGLKNEDVMRDTDAVREFGANLPASNGKIATIGFCWGGAKSFEYAAHQPRLDAAIVYYGTGPDASKLANIKAPVMGFYGEDDARVTATIQPTEEAMKAANKPFTAHIYEAAGHGFLRQQDGKNGANEKATKQAWPATLAFLRETTGDN